MLIGVDGKRCTGCVITPGLTDFVFVKGKPVETQTSGVEYRVLTSATGEPTWFGPASFDQAIGGIPGVLGQSIDPFIPPISSTGGVRVYCTSRSGSASVGPMDAVSSISAFAGGMTDMSATEFAPTDDGPCQCRLNAPNEPSSVAGVDSGTGDITDWTGSYVNPREGIYYNPGMSPMGFGGLESELRIRDRMIQDRNSRREAEESRVREMEKLGWRPRVKSQAEEAQESCNGGISSSALMDYIGKHYLSDEVLRQYMDAYGIEGAVDDYRWFGFSYNWDYSATKAKKNGREDLPPLGQILDAKKKIDADLAIAEELLFALAEYEDQYSGQLGLCMSANFTRNNLNAHLNALERASKELSDHGLLPENWSG